MKFYTAGESHGEKLTVIIEGAPYGVSLTEDEINHDLKRRSKSFGRSDRQQEETDTCHITAGVLNGITTGSPICIEIFNNAQPSSEENYIPRPGHADLAGAIKYCEDDMSFVKERASARETAARVAGGVIAKNILSMFGAEVYSFVTGIGSIDIDWDLTNMPETLPEQAQIEMNPLRCPDTTASEEMSSEIERAIQAGDTLGGKCCIVGVGLLPGLGSYNSSDRRLDSLISARVMSIPSVKSISIGSADYSRKNVGSISLDQIAGKSQDTITYLRSTNYAGGIEGGMTNGMPLVVDVGVKPVPTVGKPIRSIDLELMQPVILNSEMRHDTCVVPAVGVVAEAEIAMVLADEYLNKFGSDNIVDTKNSFDAFCTKLKLRFN